MKKGYKTILAAAISAVISQGAAAAETSQEEGKGVEKLDKIVITGNFSRYSAIKSDTPVMEMARSVSIENEQQIIDKGAASLDDTFVYSAGVTGKPYGFSTRGDWVKVRGFDVPQYQDSLQSLFGNYNNTRPHLYTLEQVEILKGPASVLYGKGSPGGIINVVSKLPKEESHTEMFLEAGSFDRKQFGFDSTGALDEKGQWLYRLVAVYRDTDTQVDHVSDKTRVFAPSITWLPTDDTSLTLLLNHTSTDSDTGAQFLPLAGTLTPAPNGQTLDTGTYTGDPDYNHYNAETTSVTLLAEHQLTQDWMLEVTSRYTDAKADYQQAWTSFIGGDRYVYNPDGSLYKGGLVPRTFYRNDATSEQYAIDARLRAGFLTGDLEHELLIGAQYQDVETGKGGYYAAAVGFDFATRGPDALFGDQFWLNPFNPDYGNVPPEALLNSLYKDGPVTNTIDRGIYFSDLISLDNWRFTLGVRIDEAESETGGKTQKDDAISSSAGVLYQFENGVSPYFSYAESFEPVIGDNGGGEPLQPQEGRQFELGVKYQPDGFPMLLTASYFDIRQSNLSDPSSLPGNIEQQSGEAEVKGVELEALAKLGDFNLEVNLSKLDTRSAKGFQLASVPENQASAWLGYRPAGDWAGFKSGAGIRHMGESYGGADTIKTDAYTLADFMMGYETGQWDLTLNLRNLADKKYNASCLSRGDCFPGERRSIVTRLRYSF